MKPVGYSVTPLAKKLGIKNKFTVRLINTPVYYFDLFVDFPHEVEITNSKKKKKDFIHYFEKEASRHES